MSSRFCSLSKEVIGLGADFPVCVVCLLLGQSVSLLMSSLDLFLKFFIVTLFSFPMYVGWEGVAELISGRVPLPVYPSRVLF